MRVDVETSGHQRWFKGCSGVYRLIGSPEVYVIAVHLCLFEGSVRGTQCTHEVVHVACQP